jgi:NADH-quinone oxidoreductase subunit A
MFASAMDQSVTLVFYLALFTGVGLAFVFLNLLIGRFVRPANAHEEKLEIYECGEPAIGSSFVQFDLRFYVVALMFIIFDVEVAFLFPWATVYGKAKTLERAVATTAVVAPADIDGVLREMGIAAEAGSMTAAQTQSLRDGARRMRLLATWEVLVFFAILLIGFAYVWRMGDLDWVRTLPRSGGSALTAERPAPVAGTGPREPALTA